MKYVALAIVLGVLLVLLISDPHNGITGAIEVPASAGEYAFDTVMDTFASEVTSQVKNAVRTRIETQYTKVGKYWFTSPIEIDQPAYISSDGGLMQVPGAGVSEYTPTYYPQTTTTSKIYGGVENAVIGREPTSIVISQPMSYYEPIGPEPQTPGMPAPPSGGPYSAGGQTGSGMGAGGVTYGSIIYPIS